VAPELAAQPGGGASPEGVLGSALVHALRQIVRGELEVRLTPAVSVQPSRWMTPPAAARLTRVPVKTIRAWARDGRIPKRLKNRSADPKQQKYLVNVDDVVAAAERVSAAADAARGESVNVQERAREILAARAAKGR
jgi:helix-turn-helix protein